MAVYYNLLNTTNFRLNTFSGRTALYVSLCIPVMTVLLAGNILVVGAVFTQRALRKPSYYILTSLAITDLLTGVIGVPLEIYRRTVTNDITCSAKWDVYFFSVSYICGLDSMIHMIMVTFDRYLAVVKPLRYNAIVTPLRIVIAVVLGWLVSIVYTLLLVAIGSTQTTTPAFYCSGVRIGATAPTIHADIATFCLTFSGGVAMVIINVLILQTAIRQSRRIAAHQCSLQGTTAQAEVRNNVMRKIKASKVVLCIVTAFIICHLPVGTMHLCLAISEDFVLNSVLIHVAYLLYFISSAVNPFIYSKMDRVFRESVMRMVQSLWNKGGSEDNGASTTDQSTVNSS